jgi:hypothetical protein
MAPQRSIGLPGRAAKPGRHGRATAGRPPRYANRAGAVAPLLGRYAQA